MVITSDKISNVLGQDLFTYLFESNPSQPDRPLFIDAHDESKSLSWHQARTMIRKIAGGLLQKGVKQSDHVGIYSGNDIYYVPVVLGVIAAGAVAVPIPSNWRTRQAADALKDTNSSWIFASPELAVAEVASMAGLEKSHVMYFDSRNHRTGDNGTPFSSLIECGETEFPRVDPQTPALLLSTSGTTGKPKVAMISHTNLIAHLVVIDGLGHHEKGYDVKWTWHQEPGHVRSFTWPLSAFRTGHPLCVVTGERAENYCSAIRKHDITDALLTPHDVELLHKHLDPNGHDQISTLRHVYVSAAPIKEFDYQSFSKLLHKDAKIARLMGITECTGVIFGLPWPHAYTAQQADEGWVGPLLVPNTRTKFIDSDGQDAGNGPGELCLQGPSVFKGYYNDQEATRRAFTDDGFYRTGDIMRFDPVSREYCYIERKGGARRKAYTGCWSMDDEQ